MMSGIEKMSEVSFGKEDIKKSIDKMKLRKQAGLDGIKCEIYKWMNQSEICVEILTRCMNKLLRDGEIPELWKKKNCPNS